MSFANIYKEAQPWKMSCRMGKKPSYLRRVRGPAPQSTTKADKEQLNGRIEAELQRELLVKMRKEIMAQMKAPSLNLMVEVR